MAKPDDDPKLREVKVVLARLQRMSSDPEAYFADLDDEETAGFPQRLGQLARSRAVWIASALLSLGLIAGSALYILSLTSRPRGNDGPALAITHAVPEPASENPALAPPQTAAVPIAPAPPVVAKNAAPRPAPAADDGPSGGGVADAMRLIDQGQVQAGRTRLRALAEKQLTAEVAWSLARSYDPNLIATIASPDAPAEVAEAERWYRQWHALAIKEGLVPGTSSVDRILQSLR